MYSDSSSNLNSFTRVSYGSTLPEVFCKKGVLRNFAKFTGKHLCQSLFLNKVAGLRLLPIQGFTHTFSSFSYFFSTSSKAILAVAVSSSLYIFKVALSPSQKDIYIYIYLPHWKPFTNDEKGFLLHLKSSFRSQDI